MTVTLSEIADQRPIARPLRLSLTGSESTHGGDVEELDMESAGFGQSGWRQVGRIKAKLAV
jgi:hypothetical protein